jgi:hydroxyacid-oxoacid transhydrogenase
MNRAGPSKTSQESVVVWEATPLKLGPGVTSELAWELERLGARSTLLVTDRNLTRYGLPGRVREMLEQAEIEVVLFDGVEVEPTDRSCIDAARQLTHVDVDSYVAVGGGSTMDTAKVLNLLRSFPADDLRRYLNKPVGEGAAVPGPLRPLVAVPTTAGSGSECTAMVALGIVGSRVKTGLGDRHLRPTVALVDPLNTLTMPAAVAASSGYDVLMHACESLTSRAFNDRPPYASPGDRPMYIGANPISDLWAEQALTRVGMYFRRSVSDADDLEARTAIAEAAAFAGMGFGAAGTHVPHANAYPIAGLVDGYVPEGYSVDHPLVPHGQAVIATAAAAFEFTYSASPERHLRAAELLTGRLAGVTVRNGQDALPNAILDVVGDTNGPVGLGDLGYTTKDVPLLVDGALKQRRLLACSPRAVDETDLARIFQASIAP